MGRFDAVFFDLGGTLFSYRSLRRPIAALIDEAGRRLGAADDVRALRRAYNAASREAVERYAPLPFYLHRDMFLDTYRGFARAILGTPADESFASWFYEAQRESMIRHLELRPDCHSTLEALRRGGLGVSIVSNIDNDYLEPMVVRGGLAERVDRWMSSETARSCKPDARFFQLCLDASGHAPERVLFVGDSPLHDIAGARGVGMRTALIEEEGIASTGDEPVESFEPDHRIRSLSDLLPIVDLA